LEEFHQPACGSLDSPDFNTHRAGGGFEYVDRETFALFIATEIREGIAVGRSADGDRVFEPVNVRKIRRLCASRGEATEDEDSDYDSEKGVAK
jgi:hypothetical protein